MCGHPRLFRYEIFARHGLEFTDATFNKIFSRTNWYKPKSKDENRIAKELNKNERVNLAILREWEWIQILDSVEISLPAGVTSVSVIGFNALLIKELTNDT
jgi:hypothetical protein